MKKPSPQLELFGGQVQMPPLPPPDPRWTALANNIPAHVKLGTSTWTFSGWTGLVYRRGYRSEAELVRESLYEYARFPVFGTVGIDRSFYNPLSEDELKWYAQLLPPGFRCVSKVWRDLTTYGSPSFLDAEMFNALIAKPYEAFLAHAGPFVIEVPPGRADPLRFERAVEKFLQAVPKTFAYAFELRERTLLTERYFAILRAHAASHCFNQWSWMPSIAEQLQLSGGTEGMGNAVVARLMLPPAADYEELKQAYAPYDRIASPQPAMRSHVLELSQHAKAHGQALFVVVNNKAEGSAPWTCIALAELLGLSARVSAGLP